MRGLDTNVLVRYLTQDDARQSKRANAVIEDALAGDGRLHVDTIVLCELVWVLRAAYRLDRVTVAAALLQLVDAAQLSLDDRDLVREAAQRYRAGPGDFADYAIGLRNRAAGCETTLTSIAPTNEATCSRRSERVRRGAAEEEGANHAQ